jgi:hypothetical protein
MASNLLHPVLDLQIAGILLCSLPRYGPLTVEEIFSDLWL